jgi:beta-glucanase (GH16 family)
MVVLSLSVVVCKSTGKTDSINVSGMSTSTYTINDTPKILALYEKEGSHKIAAGDITSGKVNTDQKFTFKYGRIDASIKLPKTADGLWPAFWMMGDNKSNKTTGGWPRCGEIDILEFGHKQGTTEEQQEYFFNGALHYGPSSNQKKTDKVYVVNNYSLQDDQFHIWTMIWDENSIKMYVNLDKYGEEKAKYFENDISNNSYFHRPFHILLNLAAGGVCPEIYSEDKITALRYSNNHEASMYIDYVKVWDLNGDLIWEDDFNGSEINRQYWNVEQNSIETGNPSDTNIDYNITNKELQYYRREGVRVGPDPESSKNCLVLTARRHF